MATKIFVNLPVKDLNKSKEFYTAIGFTINEQFTDETAACVVVSEDIYIMILTYDKYKQFTPREIADASKVSQVINALTFDNREQVDDIYNKAIKAGGSEVGATQDHGFMYSRSFCDVDGHTWESFYMDMSAVPQQS